MGVQTHLRHIGVHADRIETLLDNTAPEWEVRWAIVQRLNEIRRLAVHANDVLDEPFDNPFA